MNEDGRGINPGTKCATIIFGWQSRGAYKSIRGGDNEHGKAASCGQHIATIFLDSNWDGHQTQERSQQKLRDECLLTLLIVVSRFSYFQLDSGPM